MDRKTVILLAVAATCCAACSRGVCPDTRIAAPVERVVAEYNANASRIPRLWARAAVSVTFRDAPSDLGFTWRSGEATSYLLLDKTLSGKDGGPADFALIIRETITEIGRVGISTDEGVYYMWTDFGDRSTCLYGRLDRAGAPGIKEIPVDPLQLLGVLSVCRLPADFTKPPLVAQTYSSDPCAYVLTFIDRQPVSNKILFKREVFFERTADVVDGEIVERPRRPFMVRIFDDRGRRVLTARMDDYRPVTLADGGEEDAAPVMPSEITLRWEETGTEMRLSLSDMTTEDKVIPEAYLFRARLPARLRDAAVGVD